ncbi:potassium-transporting ATPase subunit F [Planctomicrobium piriforme]|uniref:K+-transporting ATPase, KdpF subunit n=1 Tax=Planctomicrobium piriforme TaxID=1576369 RepID=A0A1I3SZN8_9PLAN|nr:potassium-transporting ATPase subunit F [Planctomicrobium piriforme]SFJ63732.1 K+-transporting ATPase, KdpF subunit [Planctomicrobium piriforme]
MDWTTLLALALAGLLAVYLTAALLLPEKFS